MRKSFGKKHTYLGMEVEFCDDGSVKLSQVDYIKEAIADFCEELGRKAPNPASKTVFNVNPALRSSRNKNDKTSIPSYKNYYG